MPSVATRIAKRLPAVLSRGQLVGKIHDVRAACVAVTMYMDELSEQRTAQDIVYLTTAAERLASALRAARELALDYGVAAEDLP